MLKLLRVFHLISKEKYKKKSQIALVRKSPLFDEEWYLRTYPDVAELGVDPVRHYCLFGWKEGRNPSEYFNTNDYLSLNLDVKASGVNPLAHYIKFGAKEGRAITFPKKNQKKIIAKSHKGPNKGVIYTCITGGYDNLLQHTYQDRNWDYVCFTDAKSLLNQERVGPWVIRPLQFNALDNVRNARWHKTHPHKLVKEYEYSLWIDGNIDVTGSMLFDNAQKCIKEHRLLSVPEHPKRNCIYDEANEIKALKYDLPEVVDAEIAELRRLNFPEKMGLNETNILFRYHNNPKCIAMMEDWFDFIQRYSRRDQLSFNYVIWKNGYNMCNFSGKTDVRYNPTNFLFMKSKTHNGRVFSPAKSSELSMTIIIPIYNALDDLKVTLNSIENANLSKKTKIMLINDCSGQETTEFLRQFVKDKERYSLLENEKNLGFVGTCNRGMRSADTDLICLLNSDTMIPQRFETRVQDCFNSDEKIAIASPLASHSGLWNLPFKDGMTYEQMDAFVEKVSHCCYPDILCPEGFCFFVRKKVIDEIGVLDEIFGRGYCEETDLSLRAMAAGYRGVLIDNLYVYHKRHASFGSEERKIQMEKNQEILWKRWRKFYDEKMETIRMPFIKNYVMQTIYGDEWSDKDFSEASVKKNQKTRTLCVPVRRTFLQAVKAWFLSKKPKFSIIVASYNYEKYIKTTLDSLLQQTYKNFEIIVVDDGSSDNSVGIIKKYAKKHNNIKFYQHDEGKNKGLPDTLELGVSKCTGDYIAFCETDDYWTDNHLAEYVKIINKYAYPEVIENDCECFGDDEKLVEKKQHCIVDRNRNMFKRNKRKFSIKEFRTNNYITTFSAVMVKADELKKCNFLTPRKAVIDWWLWKQLTAQFPIYFIDKRLTKWRIHESYLGRAAQEKALYQQCFITRMDRFLENKDYLTTLSPKDYELIKNSKLFDEDYYKKTYGVTTDCVQHYGTYGWRKGYDPSSSFSTNDYLVSHPDVIDLDVCPLVHYEGKKE